MTYLGFHLVFIVPAILVVAAFARRRQAVSGLDLRWIAAIAGVALLYTTPWDNYLVASGVWTYGADRVLGTIGWVPIEEYLFFLLQPVLTGLWFYALLGSDEPGVTGGAAVRWSGLAGLVLLFVVGAVALMFPGGRYLGLILVWALPVVMLQWWVGGQVLWAMRRVVFLGVMAPTLYLWLCDRLAIGMGIWAIARDATTGWHLVGLPVEEALFFLITNVMVVQGLALLRVPFNLPFRQSRARDGSAPQPAS